MLIKTRKRFSLFSWLADASASELCQGVYSTFNFIKINSTSNRENGWSIDEISYRVGIGLFTQWCHSCTRHSLWHVDRN